MMDTLPQSKADHAGVAGMPPPAADHVGIVIPAWNEEYCIRRCLGSLLRQTFQGRMRIVLAANGCTDQTVANALEMAAAFEARGHALTVLEQSRRGKAAAINAAEAMLHDGPRIFLDADVELSSGAVAAMVNVLQPGTGIYLCAPRLRPMPPRSRLSRSYVAVWSRIPRVRSDVIGAGCYAVSTAGRLRWGLLPEVVADDAFVVAHFPPEQRRVIHDEEFVIRAPEGFGELVRVRSRWERGFRELARRAAEFGLDHPRRAVGVLRALLGSPGAWIHLPAYALILTCAKIRATASRAPSVDVWERAESTHKNPAAPPTRTRARAPRPAPA